MSLLQMFVFWARVRQPEKRRLKELFCVQCIVCVPSSLGFSCTTTSVWEMVRLLPNSSIRRSNIPASIMSSSSGAADLNPFFFLILVTFLPGMKAEQAFNLSCQTGETAFGVGMTPAKTGQHDSISFYIDCRRNATTKAAIQGESSKWYTYTRKRRFTKIHKNRGLT